MDRSVTIMGAGHAGTALAAAFSSQKVPVKLWAPEDHPGQLKKIMDNGDRISVTGKVDGTFPVSPTHDLGEALTDTKLVLIITRADAHESYVSALAQYNHMLKETDLFVVCGQSFTIHYADRLNYRYILESGNSPVAAKVIGDAEVNLKAYKDTYYVSCFPILRNDAGATILPADLIAKLDFMLKAKLIPSTPLAGVFASNWITHLVTAVLNMGRLADDPKELNDGEKELLIRRLHDGKAKPQEYYFYAAGMPKAVCNVQTAADKERHRVAAVCGINLPTLHKELDDEYSTNFGSIRAWSLNVGPHNIQTAAPNTIDHRYFTEELLAVDDYIAVAGVLGVKVPIAAAAMEMARAARCEDPLSSDRYNKVAGMSREDLTRFGAQFNEN